MCRKNYFNVSPPLCRAIINNIAVTSIVLLFQLEELYVEILYTILHMLGCDVEQEDQTKLVGHLKAAFHMEDEKHETLYDIACMKEVQLIKYALRDFFLYL